MPEKQGEVNPEGSPLPRSDEADDQIWTDVLPTEVAEKLYQNFTDLEITTLEQTLEVVHGPLPAHMIAREFEALLPGSAEKILHEVLEDARHARAMDELSVREGARVNRHARAYYFGLQSIGLLLAGVLGWKSIDSENYFGMLLALFLALAAIGGPLIVKLIVEKLPSFTSKGSGNE